MLKLPAEIRVLIWEYALHEAGRIEVTTHLRQPPLLRTCKQIRRETVDIWYTENDFHIHIHDLDAAISNAWARHTVSLCVQRSVQKEGESLLTNVQWTCHHSCNWDNLMVWMKVVWAGEPTYYMESPKADSTHTMAIVYGATRVAADNAAHSWAKCAESLEGFRLVVGRFDHRWQA